MILSGAEIKRNVDEGKIFISDFDEKQLNPNSYNLRLGNNFKYYLYDTLDAMEDNPTYDVEIKDGDPVFLRPGELVLAQTYEKTRTDYFAPMLSGRSSIGRLGLFVHISAGFGDVGFDGYWTLELTCVKPVIIYPKTKIAQISFYDVKGDISLYGSDNKAKYQNNEGVQSSLLWVENQQNQQNEQNGQQS